MNAKTAKPKIAMPLSDMVDLPRQVFQNMNILHIKSIKLTHILRVRCSF